MIFDKDDNIIGIFDWEFMREEALIFSLAPLIRAGDQHGRFNIREMKKIVEEYIKVFNSDDPNQLDMEERAEEAEEEYEVQLTAPYPKSEKNLPYGDKFNQKFLKDQKRKPNFKVAGGNSSKVQSTNDLPQGKSSPISGHKGK
jgi:hypothetical protein